MALVRMKRAEAAAADGDVVERLWSLALARAVQEEMGVPLRLVNFRIGRCSLAELVELLPEPSLICALDEGAGESTGVAILEAGLMAAMVEGLTTGAVTVAERGAARRPTRTDAALLAPVIDHALAGFEAGAAEAGLSDWARGFRFAATVDGGRGLSLMLEDVIYRLLEAEVDLAAGARSGKVLLAVPEGRASVATIDRPASDARFSQDLAKQVGGAAVRLDAVLMRISLPLGVVMGLQVGQELALPQAEIGRIAMEGLDGRKVGGGRLGRQGNQRAIRLVAEAADVPPPRIAPAVAERR